MNEEKAELSTCHDPDDDEALQAFSRLASEAAALAGSIRRRMSPSLRARLDPLDIVQDALLDAWRAVKAKKIRLDPKKTRALARRIVGHALLHAVERHRAECRDLRREQSLENELALCLAVDASSLPSLIEAVEDAGEAFDVDHAGVVVLRALGMTEAETALFLNLSRSAVRTSLSHVRRLFARHGGLTDSTHV